MRRRRRRIGCCCAGLFLASPALFGREAAPNARVRAKTLPQLQRSSFTFQKTQASTTRQAHCCLPLLVHRARDVIPPRYCPAHVDFVSIRLSRQEGRAGGALRPHRRRLLLVLSARRAGRGGRGRGKGRVAASFHRGPQSQKNCRP